MSLNIILGDTIMKATMDNLPETCSKCKCYLNKQLVQTKIVSITVFRF